MAFLNILQLQHLLPSVTPKAVGDAFEHSSSELIGRHPVQIVQHFQPFLLPLRLDLDFHIALGRVLDPLVARMFVFVAEPSDKGGLMDMNGITTDKTKTKKPNESVESMLQK